MNNKSAIISLSLFFLFLMNSCNMELPICTGLSSSFSIKEKKKQIEKATGLGIDFNLYFNPLILPIKLNYNSRSGFSITDEGEIALLTPLGTVGLEYSIGSQQNTTINGHTIANGDFVVGLINKKTGENNLFKIEGYNRLKVVSSGKTQIDAQVGYVEIDITNAKVQELTFVDNSKISIVNNTNTTQAFTFAVRDASGSEVEYLCEVAPLSYKYFPRFSIANSVNSFFDSEYVIKVNVNDTKNNLEMTLAKKVSLGDACHINFNQSKRQVELKRVK